MQNKRFSTLSNESDQLARTLLQSEADSDIHRLFVDIFGTQEVQKSDGNVACFTADPASFGLLIWVSAPILYRWAMDTLNSRRAKLELDATRQRIELILFIKDKGFPPDVAEQMVTKCLDVLTKRNQDDPSIEKLLSMASKINNPASLLSAPDRLDGSV